MDSVYMAFEMLIVDPVVLYSEAISGLAANAEVVAIDDSNAQNDNSATILRLRLFDSRSNLTSDSSLS